MPQQNFLFIGASDRFEVENVFIVTFSRFFFAISKIIYIFAASLVSPAVGERAVLYMRKTFSNVCRCGLLPRQTVEQTLTSFLCVCTNLNCD